MLRFLAPFLPFAVTTAVAAVIAKTTQYAAMANSILVAKAYSLSLCKKISRAASSSQELNLLCTALVLLNVYTQDVSTKRTPECRSPGYPSSFSFRNTHQTSAYATYWLRLSYSRLEPR